MRHAAGQREGIRLAQVNGVDVNAPRGLWHTVTLTNNIIVNNVHNRG